MIFQGIKGHVGNFNARYIFWAAISLLVVLFAQASRAQSIAGRWDAAISSNGISIPFELEIEGKGSAVRSYFLNGSDKVNPSNKGEFQSGALHLQFASYASELTAVLQDGVLTGAFKTAGGDSYEFRARRHEEPSGLVEDPNPPEIGGPWEIQVKSPKGETSWRFLVNQAGVRVSAAILRVDGDTGTLSGSYENGKFVLSHFAAERPLRVEVTPAEDGSLQLDLIGFRGKQTLKALRPEAARAKGLAPPADPAQHTKLKNPNEPLRFSFPDVNGQIVSNTAERFQGKVVLVNITGSWCPNCHDEAPFLEALYRQYHGQGLEIVALDFEQEDQLKDLTRLKAFINRYGIGYSYLIAGEPDQLNQKLPQAENLNAWPTTFFVGRDGLVRSIHTGFTSRASGIFDSRLKEELNSEVAHLLQESVPAQASAPSVSVGKK
ncbi:MAG TPA: TlpA disulfide reductase family protein [Candidatus Angelobacter sp.]|nr:TlpA disulfide reductase family protein [Candidatus Angelobacter sp.]